MQVNANPLEPSDSETIQRITIKTLNTISGAAGVTWIVCLTINSLVDGLTYEQLRWIAFTTAELITLGLVYPLDKKGYKHWALGFLNGLLVYANASGINAVSTGLAFFDKSEIQSDTSRVKKAALFPILRETAWWPDKRLLNEITKKDSTITRLRIINSSIRNKPLYQLDDSTKNKVAIPQIDTVYLNRDKIIYREKPTPPKDNRDVMIMLDSLRTLNEYLAGINQIAGSQKDYKSFIENPGRYNFEWKRTTRYSILTNYVIYKINKAMSLENDFADLKSTAKKLQSDLDTCQSNEIMENIKNQIVVQEKNKLQGRVDSLLKVKRPIVGRLRLFKKKPKYVPDSSGR